ncbi:MAG: translation initiation factor IF-2 N-terminal domain-containing protein, partial [Oscillospiraceae bacterium]|nr:translation initiation factor IF-2 N-terminal domain-containing protein [Oscillospiraceae bacterium]
MSSAQKYRVRDVAKDFEVTAKVITEILEKYATAPKSNMQSLTDEELNIIFDVLTLRNQVESFESLMAEVYSGKKEEEAPAEKEEAKVEKKANEKKPAGEKKSADKPKNGEKKKAEPKEEPKEEMKPKKGVQTYVIDTRGGSVDLSKYDDRVDNLVPDKVRDIGVQKQKIKKSPDRKQQTYGNKRRQEEQEKMK